MHITFGRMHTHQFHDQVFGKTIITMDGDRVDRKGSLTGGYHDIRRSRIDAVKAVAHWKNKEDSEAARHAEVKSGILQLEQEISVNLGKIQVIDSQRRALLDERQPLSTKATWIQKEEEQARDRVQRLQKALSDAEREERSLRARIDAMRAEVGTPFTQNLTNAEIRTLRDLNAQLTRQQEEYNAVTKERAEVRWDPISASVSRCLTMTCFGAARQSEAPLGNRT
jgi:structural maintenance of chromosome 3 (chondroitin sulfate proteoglycan 6)